MVKSEGPRNVSVYFVVHDIELLSQLVRFLGNYAANIKTFPHINNLLMEPLSNAPSCLITSISAKAFESDLDVIRRVRSHGLSIPVVVVATQDEDVYSAVKAIQAGAADYIQQPILERDFIERIDKVIRLH